MTNSELKEYAAANRSRLKKQKVALGDLVMILVGEFVGKNGVIKGISVCGNDFTDPYYEVDMACEVPDKYKCRKTLIKPNNVIGGLSASEFEVICSRTPESDIKEAEPKPTFKMGDEEEEKEQGCYLDFSKGIKAVLDGDFMPIDTTPIKADPIRIINDDWQSYRMELAAKIAVAYSEKGRYEPEEIGAKAVEVTNGVVERLKNGEV